MPFIGLPITESANSCRIKAIGHNLCAVEGSTYKNYAWS